MRSLAILRDVFIVACLSTCPLVAVAVISPSVLFGNEYHSCVDWAANVVQRDDRILLVLDDSSAYYCLAYATDRRLVIYYLSISNRNEHASTTTAIYDDNSKSVLIRGESDGVIPRIREVVVDSTDRKFTKKEILGLAHKIVVPANGRVRVVKQGKRTADGKLETLFDHVVVVPVPPEK